MIRFYFRAPRRKKTRFRARRLWPRKKIHTVLFRVACCTLVLAVLFLLFDARVRPLLKSGVGATVENQMTLLVHETANSLLLSEQTEYSDFVTLVTEETTGLVTAVRANTTQMNRFKASLAEQIASALAAADSGKFSVPLGTLTGSALLSGRGPLVRVRVTLAGAAKVDLASSFESAGINQTRHSILARVSVQVHAYAGTYHISTTLQTDFPVAETVIVGAVPGTYFGF